MPAFHDYRLVALSVLISVLGAYAARNLIERIRYARRAPWLAWLAWLLAGALMDGIATWSMHYTAMLGFHLPVPVSYDWPTVLFSLLIGILGSGASLMILSHEKLGWVRILAASACVGGVGISALHYASMEAMRLNGMHHYLPVLVILSIVFAITLSFASIWFRFRVRDQTPHRILQNHASSFLRGLANPAMHFTAMAAAVFVYSAQPPDLSNAVSISSLGILGISVVPALGLVVALLTSVVDRLQKQGALLDKLFEQAPEAVMLLDADNRIERVNEEFTRIFGYAAREAIGRRLDELIAPEDGPAEDRGLAEQWPGSNSVETEGIRKRKDGRSVHVSMLHVPVSLPGGKVQHYAIYRDITQRKQAELDRERLFDELHQSHDQLQTLSHRLVEVQESERKLLAREIHDDVSQSLTALIMQLGTAGSLLPRSAKAVRTILEQAEELTTSILDSTRRMIAGLRPAVLDDLGLVAALRQLGDDLQASTGAQVDMQVSRLAGRLPPQIENALARILQEALANIRRHARARRVTISLKGEPGRVILSVQDDGVGFQGQAARSPAQDDDVLIDGGWVIPAGHFGLLGIQERVRQLNGKLKVTSIPGQGTLLEVELPL